MAVVWRPCSKLLYRAKDMRVRLLALPLAISLGISNSGLLTLLLAALKVVQRYWNIL